VNYALSMLEAPDIVAINARGSLTGAQQRALGLDLLRDRFKHLAATLFWLVICTVMLRVMIPVAGVVLPSLFDDTDRGSTPVNFGSFTVTLPLWSLLSWFLALFILAYVVAFVWQIKNLVAFLFLLGSLLFGRIESVVGEVWHPNGQPIALFGGRLVRPWNAEALAGVGSGRYRFYVLPRFDWLLSAQRLGDYERPTPNEEGVAIRYSLGAVNGFDPGTLPENRAGRLTPVQAQWVRAVAPDIGCRTFIHYGIAVAFGVIGIVVYGREMLQLGFSQDRAGGIAGCLFWIAIWVGLVVKQFVDHAKHQHDADEGKVLIYTGVVTKWEGWKYRHPENSNVWIYCYICGTERFEVSREAYRALLDGSRHRAYCTPQSKQLVNIELLPFAENAARLGYDPTPQAAGYR
jgi:hypothetical protein